ncbi:hypothetical protein HF521_002765 [Silurus meridionalis]|uniref:Uncharacterized protein n=1 Tax=Silurus meridionalis TaxID=175797 RepID=A0A8T0B0W4_SILME|nr:hypothetical protein HF521_002765 [Silurus meridionalis]
MSSAGVPDVDPDADFVYDYETLRIIGLTLLESLCSCPFSFLSATAFVAVESPSAKQWVKQSKHGPGT